MKKEDKIEVKDNEECLITFKHMQTGEDSSYEFMKNPMTGSWLEIHKVGKKSSSAWISTKAQAVRLANKIVDYSKKYKLPFTVRIQARRVMPQK